MKMLKMYIFIPLLTLTCISSFFFSTKKGILTFQQLSFKAFITDCWWLHRKCCELFLSNCKTSQIKCLRCTRYPAAFRWVLLCINSLRNTIFSENILIKMIKERTKKRNPQMNKRRKKQWKAKWQVLLSLKKGINIYSVKEPLSLHILNIEFHACSSNCQSLM